MYNKEKSMIAQEKLQKGKNFPAFAPKSGICWACNANIYVPKIHLQGETNEYTTGITVESATKGLVTGCPHCNRSYCD